MTSPVEEIEFLARSEHRVIALRALREGPCDRDDLRASTDASKATVARLLNEFEDRNWVVRDGHEYELTDPGEFVAEEFLRLVDRMGTEHALRDVWQWFPTELPGCTMSLFADAVVTFPDSISPYETLPRHAELMEGTRRARAISKHTPKPSTHELALHNAAAGMETEVIFPAAVIDYMLDVVDRSVIEAAVESSHLTVLEHDSLPTDVGAGLYDDRLMVAPGDEEGVVRAMVDTDKPEAVAWFESIYEELRAEAHSVDLLERLDEEP
ncbi:MAG: transcriptional regulator [Halobacteriales archaeon]|nr:transcriptional regulator [Halobacteriales archaeon]